MIGATQTRRLCAGILLAALVTALGAGQAGATPLNPSTFSAGDGAIQHFQGGVWNDANDPGVFSMGTTTIIMDSGYTLYFSPTGDLSGEWKSTSGSSATFRNEGTVNYTATGRGGLYVNTSSGDIIVENVGTWDMTSAPGNLYRAWYSRKNPGFGRFTNTGTFLNSGGGTFGSEKDWMFDNQGGIVRVTSGSTILLGSSAGSTASQSTASGTFDTVSGRIVVRGLWSELKGVAVGSSLKLGTGGGDLTTSGATTEIGITGLGLEWDLGGNNYEIVGSSTNTIENTGLITLSGSALHHITGTGATFLNSGTFVLALAERLRLGSASGVTFLNSGTFQYAIATSRVYGHTNARFDNLPGGVMEVSTSGSHNFEGTGSGQVFRNQGTIVMINSGDMSINLWSTDSNTLDGGVLKEGAWDIGSGSVFSFEGGTADIVTINDGAEVVLRGTGSMNRLNSDLATVHGVLGIYDDAVFNAGGALEFNAGTLEFGLDQAGSAFEDTTRIDVTDFTIGAGAILQIVDLVDDLQVGDTFTLVNYSGTLTGSGNFTVQVDSGQAIGGTVDYGSGTADAITFTVTPEPATMALLACGGFAVLLRRRRRR